MASYGWLFDVGEYARLRGVELDAFEPAKVVVAVIRDTPPARSLKLVRFSGKFYNAGS